MFWLGCRSLLDNGKDTAARGESDVPERRKGLRVRLGRELPAVLCITLVLAVLVKTFLLQAFYIPSSSMAPTLLVGDRVLVSKLSHSFERGGVIVFDSPLHERVPESLPERVLRSLREVVGVQHPTAHLIKRVVAVGGDRVEIREGQVFVNGVAQVEVYLPEGSWMEDMATHSIPADHLWVMGDNRYNSRDSRSFGSIPVETVAGEVVVRLWPLKR